MASFQTFFRTVVMVATLGLLAKAWYHYGPTVDEMCVISSRMMQLADQVWADYWHSPSTSSPLAADPQTPVDLTEPTPFVPANGFAQPITVAPLAAAHEPAPNGVKLASGEMATTPATPATPNPWGERPDVMRPHVSPESPPSSDPLPALLERLAGDGVRDLELQNWGNEGNLYRFSCSVPWNASANFTRHFEAVAATPLSAVEQVTAEIANWRTSQPLR